MSAIRGKGDKDTELRMIRIFREHGITGWRRNVALFGKPDFVFRKERLAVFIDGCFWHNCPKHCRMPAGNREFWEAKLGKNRVRDRLVNRTLRAKGWRVMRIWEHDLAKKRESATVRMVRCRLQDR